MAKSNNPHIAERKPTVGKRGKAATYPEGRRARLFRTRIETNWKNRCPTILKKEPGLN